MVTVSALLNFTAVTVEPVRTATAVTIVMAVLRSVYTTKIMHIEQIHIECELSQSTFKGGLNANCKWIG